MAHAKLNGFTLIELSIVLVIIGLIIGGVLTGRDMIHAAQVRKTITQKEKFTAAANAFHNKYNCLPGDCVNPTNLGFSGGYGTGEEVFTYDGNIQYWFFEQLNEAGLIVEEMPQIAYLLNYLRLIGDSTPACPICNRAQAPGFNPSFPIGGWMVLDLGAITSLNCHDPRLSAYPATLPTFRAFDITRYQGYAYQGTIASADGFAIDAKVDDGNAFTGSVIAVSYNYVSDPSCSDDTMALNTPYCGVNAAGSYGVNASDPSGYCLDMLMKAGC